MVRTGILLTLFLAASAAEAAERAVTMKIENMTCAACPVAVRTAMKRVLGVKDVKVEFESRTAVVVFDDAQATVDQIAEASRLAGFPARPQE